MNMRLIWGFISLSFLIGVLGTNFHSCDSSCLGVYGTNCDLGQDGLNGCIICSAEFNSLDKTACRNCLVQYDNATIIGDFDFLVKSCQNLLVPKGLSVAAKVGITIGAILGFLVLVAAAGALVRQRRSAKKWNPRTSLHRFSFDLEGGHDLDNTPVSGRLETKIETEIQMPKATAIRYPEDDDVLVGGRTYRHY